MMRTKMFSLIVLTSAFAGGFALLSLTGSTATASEEHADLCLATGVQTSPGDKGGCVYSGGDVPVLASNVCWDGTTARIKGAAPCPNKQRKYFAKYGEVVEPLTGEIVAYAPLASSCNMMTCDPSDFSSEGLPDEAVCCTSDGCTTNVIDCNGEILWCKEIEYQNGELICHE